ncbi:LysR substrate-binding domain-containing protein [Yimella lutea]|uniref:LysR substrate-binding domain-containing protein n=1 Tax=Yimella lutea TaxID=587872 RepID=UPI001476A7EC|nr:LysR substrate-binding domain-containing protein [Yimella lutea]
MVSGTTSLDLWPLDQRPQKVVRVRNVDEWLEAVAAGRGVGLSAASTGLMYTHPQIVYRYLDDTPPVPITLVWRLGEENPLVSEFVATAKALQQAQRLDLPLAPDTSGSPALQPVES